jgi:hypothetical protein
VGAVYASVSSGKGHSGSCPAGDVSLSTGGTGGTDLADLAQLWADGPSTPAAVELRAHDEADPAAAKTFSSSEGAHTPVLSVTYNSYPDEPTLIRLERTEDGSYILHGRFSDPDSGATGYVAYTLVDTTPDPDTTVLSAVHGDTVASALDSPYAIPDGTIEETHQYDVTASAYDGALPSTSTTAIPLLQDNCPEINQIPPAERPTTRTSPTSPSTRPQGRRHPSPSRWTSGSPPPATDQP